MRPEIRYWLGSAMLAAALAANGLAAEAAAPPAPTWDGTAEADRLEYLHDQQLLRGEGNVTATYEDITIHADMVEINVATKDVTGRGHVRFQSGDTTWSGEQISGNFETKTFDFGEYQFSSGPWYLNGSSVSRDDAGTISLGPTSISTCDRLPTGGAHWRMEASRVVYRADGSFRANNVVYKLGNVPVFYTPVAWGNSHNIHGGFEFQPGYRSDWGGFLRIAKQWEPWPGTTTRFGVEYRTKRGPGLTNETRIKTANSDTQVEAFVLRDDDPPSDTTVAGTDYNGRFEVEEDRFRLRGRHLSTFGEHLSLRLSADYFSDNDMLREFYRDDYRRNPQAASFVDLSYMADRYELSLNYRPRLNDFESVVERLPEFRLDLPRQRVFQTPLYYQGENSVANLRMNWREYDLQRPLPPAAPLMEADDYFTTRFDSLHMLFLPLQLQGFSVIPRAGVRYTYYSRSSDAEVTDMQWQNNLLADDPRPSVSNPAPVTTYDDNGGARSRVVWELGLELNTKFYRTRNDLMGTWFGLDGLRHVVQPYVNYTYIPEPNVDKENLYFFDLTDRMDQMNFVRLGGRHRWQTRRPVGGRKRIYTFARMENYYDFHFQTDGDLDHSGDLGTVLEVLPRENVELWAKILVDTGIWDLHVFNAGATFGDPEGTQVRLSYLFRDAFPSRVAYSMGSELTRIQSSPVFPIVYEENHNAVVELRVPLGSKWRFETEHYFDLDRGRVAYQSYELIRDMHCWVGSLRVVKEPDDLAIMLAFYLKAFPGVRVRGGL